MGSFNHHASYNKDFYAWAMENAELLRRKKFEEIDIENLSEEIESMGKSEKRSAISHLRLLITHLLKWMYQPDFRSNSWKFTIRNTRYQIKSLLEDSPSLKNEIQSKFSDTYQDSVIMASDETGVLKEDFPKTCPFTLENCLDNNFLPD